MLYSIGGCGLVRLQDCMCHQDLEYPETQTYLILFWHEILMFGLSRRKQNNIAKFISSI